MAGILQSIGYRDAKGHVAHVRFYIDGGAGTAITQQANANTLITDISALSNAQRSSGHGPATASPTATIYGNTAQFQNAEDKAVFVFQTVTGVFHRYQIPAPKASIFLTDLETVDISVAAVATFIADAISFITDANANHMTAFIGAVRLRRKLQRRLNITVLGPGDVIETPAE